MTNTRYRNSYVDEHCHFCTATVFGYKPVLLDDVARRLLITSWKEHKKRWNVTIYAFVMMPEHIHIVVKGSADGVRKFMQYSLAQASKDIRSMLERKAEQCDLQAIDHLHHMKECANGTSSGKLWKERFRAVALDREDAILVKLEYIHNNPVKRGLAEKPEQWVWSSYSNYISGKGIMPLELDL